MREVAEQLTVHDAEAYLITNGFGLEGECWKRFYDKGFSVQVVQNTERSANGVMTTFDITACGEADKEKKTILHIQTA